jgi:hypothetical protein
MGNKARDVEVDVDGGVGVGVAIKERRGEETKADEEDEGR